MPSAANTSQTEAEAPSLQEELDVYLQNALEDLEESIQKTAEEIRQGTENVIENISPYEPCSWSYEVCLGERSDTGDGVLLEEIDQTSNLFDYLSAQSIPVNSAESLLRARGLIRHSVEGSCSSDRWRIVEGNAKVVETIQESREVSVNLINYLRSDWKLSYAYIPGLEIVVYAGPLEEGRNAYSVSCSHVRI